MYKTETGLQQNNDKLSFCKMYFILLLNTIFRQRELLLKRFYISLLL